LFRFFRCFLDLGLIDDLSDSPDTDSQDERRRYYGLTGFGRRVAMAEARRLSAMLSQARETGLIPKKL
jgi:hypothetical protein